MRILVIGGTRFIGPPAVARLHAMGHTLRLFHRTPAHVDLPADIEHVLGDRHEIDRYADELRDFAPDVVLDMIAITEADARGVVETFRGVAGRVVAISSQDVYRAYGRVNGIEPGPPDEIPIDEDGPLRERLFPYRSETPRMANDPRKILDNYDKILVERVVMNEPELPGTVLRLPMVYGPRDYQHRLFPYLKRIDDGRPAILLSDQMANWRWTRDYVENTAAAIAHAINDERAAGRIYNVGETIALSIAEWIRAIGQAAGWQGDVVTAPDYQLPDNMKSQAGLEQDLVFDCTRIITELDFEAPVTRDTALWRTVKWERAHPPEQYDASEFDYATEDAILTRL
jgi:nucleoside-diphosphate-sugar epimerase